MNIGCDLDGVIIDHCKNQRRLLKKRGFDMPLARISKEVIKRLLGPEEYRVFQQELYGEISREAEEVDGAKKGLEALISYGHEIRIISCRSENRNFALGWLRVHGFYALFKETRIHFVDADEKKEEICKMFSIKLHIDDSPKVLGGLYTPVYKILLSKTSSFCPVATHIVRNWPDLVLLVQKIT